MSNNINNSSMLKVGTVLHGTYRIDGYLSSGGFGNTYVATNIEFDEKYAIKEFFMRGVSQRDGNNTTVSVSNADNEATFEAQREKFKKEARRLRRLNSDHIVRVYDLFEENGTAYYVMDYIDGENLSDKLKHLWPLREDEIINILYQVLDALDAAHKEGIWHLDLKPANIMLDKNGVVKLIDFGASKQQSASGGATTSTAVSYTNGYAPREQMEQNLDKFGPWTDFYALGATLYNLLTNKKPPLPSDIDEDHSDDKHKALPMSSEYSDKLRTLVLWLLKTNREDRPQKVEDIYNYLQTVHAPYEAGKPSNDEQTLLKRPNPTELDAYSKLSFNDLLEKAENGDDKAQSELGSRYFNGIGIKKNYKAAFKWFEKSAESGSSYAECSLAFCYYNGEGVKRDYNKALYWFNKSADQGEAAAQNQLGIMYAKGKGVKKDSEQARLWFIKASKNGFKEADENLKALDEKQMSFIKRHNSMRVGKGEKLFLKYLLWFVNCATIVITTIVCLVSHDYYENGDHIDVYMCIGYVGVLLPIWIFTYIIMWLSYIPKRRFFIIQTGAVLLSITIIWVIAYSAIYNPEIARYDNNNYGEYYSVPGNDIDNEENHNSSYEYDNIKCEYEMHSHSPFDNILRVSRQSPYYRYGYIKGELEKSYYQIANNIEEGCLMMFCGYLLVFLILILRPFHRLYHWGSRLKTKL